MANINAPFGFRPLMTCLSGAPPALRQYGKPASDANAIFINDLVKKVASSTPDPVGALAVPMPNVQTAYQGTPGTTLWVGASLDFGAASKATPHYVVDEVSALYAAQCANVGPTSITVAAHVGKNANISIAVAGSSLSKQSGLQVDDSTIAATATLDVKILGVFNVSPNAEGNFAIVEVMINKHLYAQGAAGV